MQSHFRAPTTYFLAEGKENLTECLAVAFDAAREHDIGKIIIFTAEGEGIRLAIENFRSQPQFQGIKLVGVTFPKGKRFTDATGRPRRVEIPPDLESQFQSQGVPIIRAHLPFDPILPPFGDRGVLAQDLSLVGDALNMFCGSMSLCVQAVVLACDAGAVGMGEHVIALTSDTAILARASCTRQMLSSLVIREILCKPAILTIGRKEVAERLIDATVETQPKAIGAGKPRKGTSGTQP